MLQTGNALGAHIYSPKAVKYLKFIAHNWRLIMDFIAMLHTYKTTLEQIAHPMVCNIHIFQWKKSSCIYRLYQQKVNFAFALVVHFWDPLYSVVLSTRTCCTINRCSLDSRVKLRNSVI